MEAEEIRSFLAQPVTHGDAASYYCRANEYLDRGDLAAAIEDYTRAIRLKPGYADALVNRGLAYHDMR